MELRRYIAILRKRALLIILCMVAGVTAAYVSTSREPSYEAAAQIYVGQNRFTTSSNVDAVSNDELAGVRTIAATYSLMIDSVPIATEALARVPGIDRSAEKVVDNTVSVPVAGTTLLNIKLTDKDPAVAQQLTNAMVDAFVDKIQTFDPSTTPREGEVPQLPAYVFDRARLPDSPIASALPRRVALGFVFSFLLAAGIAFLLEYLDITIKTAADAEQRLELPVLGVIPMQRQAPSTHSRAASVL